MYITLFLRTLSSDYSSVSTESHVSTFPLLISWQIFRVVCPQTQPNLTENFTKLTMVVGPTQQENGSDSQNPADLSTSRIQLSHKLSVIAQQITVDSAAVTSWRTCSKTPLAHSVLVIVVPVA